MGVRQRGAPAARRGQPAPGGLLAVEGRAFVQVAARSRPDRSRSRSGSPQIGKRLATGIGCAAAGAAGASGRPGGGGGGASKASLLAESLPAARRRVGAGDGRRATGRQEASKSGRAGRARRQRGAPPRVPLSLRFEGSAPARLGVRLARAKPVRTCPLSKSGPLGCVLYHPKTIQELQTTAAQTAANRRIPHKPDPLYRGALGARGSAGDDAPLSAPSRRGARPPRGGRRRRGAARGGRAPRAAAGSAARGGRKRRPPGRRRGAGASLVGRSRVGRARESGRGPRRQRPRQRH